MSKYDESIFIDHYREITPIEKQFRDSLSSDMKQVYDAINTAKYFSDWGNRCQYEGFRLNKTGYKLLNHAKRKLRRAADLLCARRYYEND